MAVTTTLNKDAELVKQASQGSDKAFRELVNQYTRLVYNHIYRMSNNLEMADELTQEVFVKVYRNLDKFDHSKPFKPWLMRIASNTTISQFRKNAKVVSLTALEDSGHWKEVDHHPQMPDTSEIVEARLSSEMVLDVMNSLDPKYREVLLLRYKEEFSYDEIAETMEVPLNTVRTWLKRGRDFLKKEIKRTQDA